MGDDARLVLVFMPPLTSLLLRAEEMKGSPLTEEEVLRVRGRSICMTMRPEHALALEEKRGYRDLDPEDCWAGWQRLRAELGNDPPPER